MDAPMAMKGGQEKSISPTVTAEGQSIPKQRLVVCFDGTWNKRDSGTNIYHLSNLIVDTVGNDVPKGERCQRVYYDEGVGTGVIDGITGGGFGLGLSENVVEAYDWLVEKYCEGDEIYIFGFSRGAFTARSLVGLIGKCGLLYRGAPLPPGELWQSYQILGRHENVRTGSEPDKNWWERIFGKPGKIFRPLLRLKADDWGENGTVHEPPTTRSERLLVQWSRRVKIKCVGVFDTVGSMGLDALAIPWVRDFSAQFHDTRLTSLIENGLQALAIDEHRANFIHIPWHGAVGEERQVQQKWFIGAHSNVGGGYEDNALSQASLKWMIEECAKLGLKFRDEGDHAPKAADFTLPGECCPLYDGEPENPALQLAAKPGAIRDSYADFTGGFWQYIIRAKRNYRRIAPPPELLGGQTVQSMGEALHESVSILRAQNTGTPYLPPNLYEYLQRQAKEANVDFHEKPPAHQYLEGKHPVSWLLAWMLGLAVGGWWIAELLIRGTAGHAGAGLWSYVIHPFDEGRVPWSILHVSFVAILPLIAVAIDYLESRVNHALALAPDGVPAHLGREIMNGCLGARLLFLGILAMGLALTVWHWSFMGWPLSPGLQWLGVIDALLLALLAFQAWCAAPMTDAGLGSILKLQNTKTPEEVASLFQKWAGDRPKLLWPVAVTLFRDIFGFIPVYSLVFFTGTWLALALVAAGLAQGTLFPLFPDGHAAWPLAIALTITVVCALADLLEDLLHFRYLHLWNGEPRQSPPSSLVQIARGATATKMLLVVIGSVMTLSVGSYLAVIELFAALFGSNGLFALAVVGLFGALAYSVVMGARPPDEPPDRPAGTIPVSTPPAPSGG
jgi:uncharacterized protein (DUF2235 family)